MKKGKNNSFYAASIVLFLIITTFVVTSCETSRVGPDIPTPNPPVPPVQPLILSGFVKNAADLTTISGVSVKITKADASVLATVQTDNNGKYVFDATAVTENTLIVSASKDGYGFKSNVADINKTANLAIVADILLAKIVAALAPVTVATGGTATTTSGQSVASQPLTVSVPPNAVAQPITLTAAAVPAAQIPPVTTTSNSTVQAAGQFGPSGTQFQQPVTITFPLPSSLQIGKTFALMQLNEQTGAYVNSGFTATVNSDGTSASADVTHFTIYALADETDINLSSGTPTTGSSSYFGLAGGSGTRSFTATNTYSASGGSGTVSDSWLRDIVSQNLKVDFGTTTTVIGGNFPELPSNYQSNGVQTNPNIPGKGNWEYRWYVLKQTITTTGTASGAGWSRNINVVQEKWINVSAQTGWYWRSHDQGGAISGPF